MSDTAVSVLVALLAGLLIAVLFIAVGINKRKKLMGIDRYCQEKGYSCSHHASSLERTIEVKGDGFVLQSKESSQYHDAQTGSDSWRREVQWRSDIRGNEDLSFYLGAIQSSLAWDRLPEMMKTPILRKMGITDHPDAFQGAPEVIKIKNGTLLLMGSGQIPRQKIERIADELAGWPSIQGLTIKAEGKDLIIRLANASLSSSSEIERFISLGLSIRGLELSHQ